MVSQGLLPDIQRFSLVFIDGLHTAEGVKLDFELGFAKLVKGGVMVFDDYFSASIPDYTEMIDVLVQQYKQGLVRDEYSKLVYFRKE